MSSFNAPQHSTLAAYVLWFFLGAFGVHRFYLGRTMSGVCMLLLTLMSIVTMFILIGFVGYAILCVWWLVDALLIPGMVRSASFA